MTLTLSLPVLVLIGISLALFVGATILAHSQSMFDGGGGGYAGGLDGLFTIILYVVVWVVP